MVSRGILCPGTYLVVNSRYYWYILVTVDGTEAISEVSESTCTWVPGYLSSYGFG